MRFGLVVVSSFASFYAHVVILLDFLYVFVKFGLEDIFCSAVGFELYSLDHFKHVVLKFIEGANLLRWTF